MKTSKFSFIYKKKKFNLNVRVCDNLFSQTSGLMFRKKSKPLLFIFKKAKQRGIHSFFCVPFFAIWFNNQRVVDAKLITPWQWLVMPNKKFDKLLEIPSNDLNFKKFIDDLRKI